MTEHHLSPCDGELKGGSAGPKQEVRLADGHVDRCSGRRRQRQVASMAGLRQTSNGRSGSEIKVCFRCTDGTGDKALECQMSHQVNQ